MSIRVRQKSSSRTLAGTQMVTTFQPEGASFDSGVVKLTDKKVCKDFTSPEPYIRDNPLDISRTRDGAVVLDGFIDTGLLWAVTHRVRWNHFPIPIPDAHFGGYTAARPEAYVAAAIEKAIPNASATDVVEVVTGLPQLASSVLDLSRRLAELSKNNFQAGTISQAYLSNEFGFQQFWDDLNLVARAQMLLERAARRYNRIESGKSIKVTLFRVEGVSSALALTTFPSGALKVHLDNSFSVKVWGTVRFKPNGRKAPSSKLMLGSLLGLDKPLVSLWNLIPFSFIADWFVDLGSFLGQYSGHHELSSVCIMRHSQANNTAREKSLETYGLTWLGEDRIRLSNRSAISERKERYVTDTFGRPVLKPFLGPGQIATLAALYTK